MAKMCFGNKKYSCFNEPEYFSINSIFCQFVAGETGLEPATNGFGDRYSTN